MFKSDFDYFLSWLNSILNEAYIGFLFDTFS